MKLSKPQIIAIITPVITLVAGYFGYAPIQELREPTSVDVSITVPDHKQVHKHKDWSKDISQAVKKANDERDARHIDGYH